MCDDLHVAKESSDLISRPSNRTNNNSKYNPSQIGTVKSVQLSSNTLSPLGNGIPTRSRNVHDTADFFGASPHSPLPPTLHTAPQSSQKRYSSLPPSPTTSVSVTEIRKDLEINYCSC